MNLSVVDYLSELYTKNMTPSITSLSAAAFLTSMSFL